jgi:hypothetical protein
MLPRYLSRAIGRKARTIVAAAFVLAPNVAQAEGLDIRPGPAFGRAAREACGGDITLLCGEGAYGRRRIVQCLISHRDRLSPDCRRFVAEATSTRRSMFACAADARRLCANTLPGGGRIVSCLYSQRDALSRDCARALDEAASIGR